MINLFAVFNHHRLRAIPFNTYRQPGPESPRETPGNQCKILSFKYHNGFLTGPHLTAGNQTVKCRLDFIWDHLQ